MAGNRQARREKLLPWNGRELVGATIGSNEYSFTYDDQGIRTSKTKDGKTVNYYYSGGVLIGEASDDYAIFYMYSGDTTPVGMIYYEWYTDAQCYWYEKNLHGDIVALYGEDMSPVVESTYDAWGNATVIYKNGGALSGVACGWGMGVGAILYGAATIATSGAVSYAITGFIAAFSISRPGSFGANILQQFIDGKDINYKETAINGLNFNINFNMFGE